MKIFLFLICIVSTSASIINIDVSELVYYQPEQTHIAINGKLISILNRSLFQ